VLLSNVSSDFEKRQEEGEMKASRGFGSKSRDEVFEHLSLLSGAVDVSDRTKCALGDSKRGDVLLNPRNQPEEHQHLRDPGTSQRLPAGDVGLGGDLPGVELPPPLEDLAKRFDHGWRPGSFGGSGGRAGYRDGGNHAVGGYLARQDADIAVFERLLRPKCDFDRLFTEFDRTPVLPQVRMHVNDQAVDSSKMYA